jgi:hypothetical protein
MLLYSRKISDLKMEAGWYIVTSVSEINCVSIFMED